MRGRPRKCGKLQMSMYGTKAAGQNWQKEVTETMVKLGFKAGKLSPVIFHHDQKGMRTLVHGDDSVSSAIPEDLKWLQEELAKKYEITTKIMGEKPDMEKEVKILNRTLKWIDGVGIQYEVGSKHAEKIIKETRADKMKGLHVPIVREDSAESDEHKERSIEEMKRRSKLGHKAEKSGEVLDPRETTRFRALAARANFLAVDRPDIIFAAKELTRKMAEPTKEDWEKLVRPGRHLKTRPKLKIW